VTIIDRMRIRNKRESQKIEFIVANSSP